MSSGRWVQCRVRTAQGLRFLGLVSNGRRFQVRNRVAGRNGSGGWGRIAGASGGWVRVAGQQRFGRLVSSSGRLQGRVRIAQGNAAGGWCRMAGTCRCGLEIVRAMRAAVLSPGLACFMARSESARAMLFGVGVVWELVARLDSSRSA